MPKKTNLSNLSGNIDQKLLNELVSEYDYAKRYHFIGDWEKSVLHAGKFSELTMAIIKNIEDGDVLDINDIHFDQVYNNIINRTKNSAEDDILMLAIPRVARSIYDIRNKKRVAHVKAIDPNCLDSQFCVSGCDWILAQIVMLYSQATAEETASLLHSLIEKQVPFMEQFEDGTMVILRDNMTFKDQLLICLYKLDKRTSKKELSRILKTYDQLVNTSAKSLENEKLVNINEQGIMLTKNGLIRVEKLLSKN